MQFFKNIRYNHFDWKYNFTILNQDFALQTSNKKLFIFPE